MADESLVATIRRFALRLRREHAAEIERDPHAFKRRAVSCFRRALPPGPGRPCDEAISRASELRGAGTPWKEIYPLCISGFATLNSAARQLAQSRLRSALRSRQNIRKRKAEGRRVQAIPAASRTRRHRTISDTVCPAGPE